MSSSPYRAPAERPTRTEERAEPLDDRDLIPVFALLWVTSVVQVALGVARGAEFGAELTLAAAAVFVVPLLARNGVTALLSRRRARRPDDARRP